MVGTERVKEQAGEGQGRGQAIRWLERPREG